MKLSQLIKMLQAEQARVGDVEVTMQATLLPDGFSASGSKSHPDVFESTVENVLVQDDDARGKRVRLFWQT